MKIDLPVIILKGIPLLPNNKLKLDLDTHTSKNIIDTSEMFHNYNVLIVSSMDPLEENIKLEELSKIGVMAKIESYLDLPNEKTRIHLIGLNRVQIHQYLNMNNDSLLEAIVSKVIENPLDEKENKVIKKTLIQELEKYIKEIPYVSNSFINIVKNLEDVSKIIDSIVPHLQTSNERLFEYLYEIDLKIKAQMVLDDISQEREIFEIEKRLDLKLTKEINQSQKEHFLREKIKIIQEELGDTDLKETEIDKLRQKLKQLKLKNQVKEKIEHEIKRYESLPIISPESGVIKNYLDWILSLPWNTYTIDNDDLIEVRKKLDQSHSGLEKVKDRIIEYLAVKQLTNKLNGPIICLVGPPGVGKTSLAFSIANAMNRKFVKMSVGGISDENEIIGHRRTYIGASPGRIITSIKKAKSSNPVFLIDEIDKMMKNFKGDPASVLLEILDPEQNKYFIDNYLEEEYDLSKIMFIATANYIEDIPEALKDRLEIVELSGYTEYEKLDIAQKYLIPKICKEHGINSNCVIIKEDILLKLIRGYTKETGVRELDRLLSSIIRKIITTLSITKIARNKFIVDSKKLVEYLGKEKYSFHKRQNHKEVGVVNALAYTYFGGDILPIEVTMFKGNGELILTGSLGKVMEESAIVALNYIKSNWGKFGIDIQLLKENNIHIHVPEGAIPKDGPSAGIALTTALISLLTNTKIPSFIALTGEITLRGNVLPIGGLREKCIGALRSGIKTIFMPYENRNDLELLPKEVKDNIEFILIKKYEEIWKVVGEKNEKKAKVSL